MKTVFTFGFNDIHRDVNVVETYGAAQIFYGVHFIKFKLFKVFFVKFDIFV